uniref:Uncharacterized protein n=1 Tax=Anopheles atroparvus TaxID=41427 RepID=A0A182JDN2_ANOAO
MSELVCTSPQHYGDETPPHPSRSSMESIIEDQRYLPMDLKKPPPPAAVEPTHEPMNPSGSPGGSGQLQLISRLLRSSNLQSPQCAATGATPASASVSAGKMGLIGLKMALMSGGGGGGSGGAGVGRAGCVASSSAGGSTNGCSCSSPSSHPPPATYSTGSDGSSYSIDESTDSFITDPPTPDEGNGYKVINHLNSGGSIPEENSEEFIKDYGHIDLRLGGGLSQHDEYGSGAQTHFRMSPQSDGKPSSYTSYPQNHHHTSTINARLGHHHNSLSLPISQAARRGGSPAPPSTVGSVEGSAYMEMCSPSGSSPGDPSGSCYMAMSPVADYSRGLCSSSSAHSRASSLAEDLVDGYVPMNMSRTVTTQPPPEEYVIMDPTQNGTSSRLSNATSGGGGGGGGGNGMAGGIGGMSSAASSCSITSGTPSTDLRLSLEKVPAYIGQSDEGEVNDRPYRTYSVGSRPEHIKRKLRIDMLSSAEGGLGGGGGGAGGGSTSSRQRAFSVGSRAKVPRCSEMYKGYSQAPIIVSFVSSSSQGSVTESNNNSGGSTSSIPHVGSFGGGVSDTLPNLPLDESAMGGKSGSGSLLVEWKPPLGSGGTANHGSVDHMADLMEIDYSSPRQPGADEATGHNSSSTPLKKPGAAVIPGMEDYLDMSGSGNAGYGDSPSNNYNSHALKDLFEDKEHPVLPPALSMEGDYLNMTPGSSDRGHVGEDVVDGSHGAGSSKSTSNPIQISSPKKYGGMEGNSAGKNNNYLDMYPRMQQVKAATGSGPSAGGSGAVPATKVPSEDYLNMTPLMMMSSAEKSGSEEKMLGSVSSGSAPEGYMEMSFNHSTTANSNNVPSAMVPLAEDYMNMSAGTAPSAPITIQPIAGKCRLDLSGESKVEASANIPNYLPLGHHHHTPHHPHAAGEATRKSAQAATTIVSLQQPVQTTTGQQSGSIGFSPSKGGGGAGGGGGLVLRARCDSRDSGIMTPSGSQATIFPFSPGSPTQSFPDGSSSGETSVKQQPAGAGMETLEDLSQNYAELSLGRQQQVPGPLPGEAAATMTPLARKLSTGSRSSGTFGRAGTLASPGVVQPDYVNFCPVAPTTPTSEMPATQQQQPQTTARSRVEDDGAGDYALMNPASARKQSTTSMGGGSVVGAGCSPSASSSSVASSSSPPVLVAKKSTFLSNPLMGFKPIASTQDAELLAQGPPAKVLNCTASSPKATFSRRMDGVSTAFSFDQSAQPPLQRSFSGTRPNSVNSELITGRGAVAVIGGAAGGTSTPTSTGGGGTTRPNSANSERLPIISATSSSASSTSTLCESKNQSPSASCTAIAGSSSTVVESRPDSVSSVTDPHFISRPPSVSSERELHYASLDLPPCSKTTAAAAAAAAVGLVPAASPLASSASSSALLVQKMDVDEPYDVLSTSSPSPGCTSQQTQQPVRCGGASTYAQIDFLRSQAPKQQSAVSPAGPSPSAGSGTGGSGAPQSSQA